MDFVKSLQHPPPNPSSVSGLGWIGCNVPLEGAEAHHVGMVVYLIPIPTYIFSWGEFHRPRPNHISCKAVIPERIFLQQSAPHRMKTCLIPISR